MFKESSIEKKLKLDYALTREVSERSIEEYKEFLQIPITRKFLGEKVLDLGSGVTGRFAKEATEQGIEIYSLTPAFINKLGRKNFLKGAAGLVQDLPYKSNVFDSVYPYGRCRLISLRTKKII